MLEFASVETPRNVCKAIARAVAFNNADMAIDTINAAKVYFQNRATAQGKQDSGWSIPLNRPIATIRTNEAHHSVFMKDGNSKLPFVAFSTLPEVTCPGAGECLEFCYSFKAWQYPSAFVRQCGNTWLLRSIDGRDNIEQAFMGLFKARKLVNGFTFRLYVDGDFSNMSDVQFWMRLIKANPSVQTYGYSKSLALLNEYATENEFPANYIFNLSSGHNADDAAVNKVKALPIYRGEFRAVNIGRFVLSADHNKPEHKSELRKVFALQNAGAKAFACPGKCGECTSKGHACGSDAFRNIPIIIAVH